MPLGVLINVAAIIFGTLVGSLIGGRLSLRFRETAMSVIGCVTMVLGMQMAMASHSILLMLVSLLLGAALGEWWNIDALLQRVGNAIEARVSPASQPPSAPLEAAAPRVSIAQAFVTASLIFVVGPMTFVGSIQDGVSGDYKLIAIKSLLDLISSITLSATLGWGVGLSIITIAIVQGGISLTARALGADSAAMIADATVRAGKDALPLGKTMLDEMSAAGGILMIGTGLLLLELKKIRVANLLPAIVLAPALVLFFCWMKWPIAP